MDVEDDFAGWSNVGMMESSNKKSFFFMLINTTYIAT